MKYRNYFKNIFKELIDKSFFETLDGDEASPENFEALLEVLKGNVEADEYPQLTKVLEIIWERISEFEFATETEEEMDTIHKTFQEAIAALEF